MEKMKINACGKEYELHISPGSDRPKECMEAIRKITEFVENSLCETRANKNPPTEGASFYSEGKFDAYRSIKNILDDAGYYTDL